MAPGLTLQRLRATARLYRAGVDGAHDELAAVIAEHADALPALLGFPTASLSRLFNEPNVVELLVSTIEAAPRVASETARRAAMETARRAGSEVTATSVVHDDGDVELGVVALYQALCRWPGGGVVVLGERGSLDLAHLRAVMRACTSVDAISVLVRADDVVVAYTTGNSRGVLRLLLMPIRPRADALVVELPSSLPVVELEPSAAVAPTPAAPPLAQRAPLPFAWHLVDAIAAALGGGP